MLSHLYIENAMADAVSHSSLDSTTDDYVLVNGEPKLKVITTPRAYEYESTLRNPDVVLCQHLVEDSTVELALSST